MIERTLIERDEIWLGYINSNGVGRMRDIALLLPDVFDAFPYALITCIDGGRGPWVTKNGVAFFQDESYPPPYRIVENSILISGEDFRKIVIADDLLGAMDEVWFYETAPDTTPPQTLKLTSEGNITRNDHPSLQQKQEAVIEWALLSDCLLGLGDGHGLNFVTPSSRLAHQLIGATPGED